MLQAVIAGIAVVVGIALGYWIRSNAAKSEKALLEQRNRESADALAASWAQLAEAQAVSAARAGFESVAAERAGTIERLTAERDAAQTDLESSRAAERNQAARISQLEAELNSERQKTPENLALLQEAQKHLSNQFEALAGNILDQKSKTLSEGSQKELGTLLTPLREQIKEFREKVERVQLESTSGVTELKTLIGTLGTLNQSLTQEAHNLATALRRDTRAQGNWGETILLNILDKSGLQEGIHYTFQQSLFEENGEGETGQRRQTDVLVNLPGGRHLVIDSKVSLNAYNDSVNAQDERLRADATKKHLANVRNHCTELAERNYHSLIGIQSPDFVVMFVPIEPAFMLALQEDEGLWFEAYRKGIVLAGPTTVLLVIRIVENLWRQEQQIRSVKEVMDMGGKLYVKFASFVNDMADLGKNLRDASKSYDDAKKKLCEGRDNLVRQAEKLRDYGIKPKLAKKFRPVPATWLASADLDDEDLELAAEADDSQLEIDLAAQESSEIHT